MTMHIEYEATDILDKETHYRAYIKTRVINMTIALLRDEYKVMHEYVRNVHCFAGGGAALYCVVWLWLQTSYVEKRHFLVYISVLLYVTRILHLFLMRRLCHYLRYYDNDNRIVYQILLYGIYLCSKQPSCRVYRMYLFFDKHFDVALRDIARERPYIIHHYAPLTWAVIQRLAIMWYYAHIQRLSYIKIR